MAREIPLTQGKFATVDDADYEWLNQWKWYYSVGYAMRTAGGRKKKHVVCMHRLITSPPDDMYVDHIDSDRLNNQRSNLRIVTRIQNNQHVRPRTGYTSQYKGVHYNARAQKWNSEITVMGKRILLGTFISELEAANAYNMAAKQHHGDFCLLNDLTNHVETSVVIKPLPPKTSLYDGVYFAKDRGKWRASLTVSGKKLNIGTFATEQEAINAIALIKR